MINKKGVLFLLILIAAALFAINNAQPEDLAPERSWDFHNNTSMNTEGNGLVIMGYPKSIHISFRDGDTVEVDTVWDGYASDREEELHAISVFYVNGTGDVRIPNSLGSYPMKMSYIQGSIPFKLVNGSVIGGNAENSFSLKEWAVDTKSMNGEKSINMTRN